LWSTWPASWRKSHAGDFQRIHAEGRAAWARLAAATGVEHLVHLSAIGADPASPSRYGASKAAGEQAVRAAFPRATILRPSIVFGPEDNSSTASLRCRGSRW